MEKKKKKKKRKKKNQKKEKKKKEKRLMSEGESSWSSSDEGDHKKAPGLYAKGLEKAHLRIKEEKELAKTAAVDDKGKKKKKQKPITVNLDNCKYEVVYACTKVSLFVIYFVVPFFFFFEIKF